MADPVNVLVYIRNAPDARRDAILGVIVRVFDDIDDVPDDDEALEREMQSSIRKAVEVLGISHRPEIVTLLMGGELDDTSDQEPTVQLLGFPGDARLDVVP